MSEPSFVLRTPLFTKSRFVSHFQHGRQTRSPGFKTLGSNPNSRRIRDRGSPNTRLFRLERERNPRNTRKVCFRLLRGLGSASETLGRDRRKSNTSPDRGTRSRGYYGLIPHSGLLDGSCIEHCEWGHGWNDDP